MIWKFSMSDLNAFRKTVLSAKSTTKPGFQAKRFEKESEQRIEPDYARVDIERLKFCIHCGFPIEEGNCFCTECGAKIAEETEKAEKETDSVENITEKNTTQQSLKISADRMASIKETELVKSGKVADEFKKRKTELLQQQEEIENQKRELKNRETELLYGNYAYTYHQGTMYLSIENIIGSKVSATIKTDFLNVNSGYAIEKYSGTFIDNRLELYLTNADLYPSPGRIIYKSYSFSGTFSDNKIPGELKGQHDPMSVVFEKI